MSQCFNWDIKFCWSECIFIIYIFLLMLLLTLTMTLFIITYEHEGEGSYISPLEYLQFSLTSTMVNQLSNFFSNQTFSIYYTPPLILSCLKFQYLKFWGLDWAFKITIFYIIKKLGINGNSCKPDYLFLYKWRNYLRIQGNISNQRMAMDYVSKKRSSVITSWCKGEYQATASAEPRFCSANSTENIGSCVWTDQSGFIRSTVTSESTLKLRGPTISRIL